MGHNMSSAVSSAVEKQLSAYLPGSSKEEQSPKHGDVADSPNSPAFKGHHLPAKDHSKVDKDRSHSTPSKDHTTGPGRFLTRAR